MNEHLIALIKELSYYGFAYIELSSGHVIKVISDDVTGIAKLRVATGAEDEFEDCGIHEVTNLLEVHQVKEIR